MQLSQEEFDRAKRLKKSGKSFAEIGRILGYSRSSIWYSLMKGGEFDKEGHQPNWDADLGIAMMEAGYTFAEIAEFVDENYDTVRIWLTKYKKRVSEESCED